MNVALRTPSMTREQFLDWARTATRLTGGETLHLDELGFEVRVSEFYTEIEFPQSEQSADQR
jgi:hypothetical protein